MALEEDAIIVADITPDQVLQDISAAGKNDVVFTECPNETFNQKGGIKLTLEVNSYICIVLLHYRSKS